MRLIADSGSTKTEWALIDAGAECETVCEDAALRIVRTQGLSPVHQGREQIVEVLRSELLPQLGGAEIGDVRFYGSGVRPELRAVVTDALRSVFPAAREVEAESDLLGACRAMCGRQEGIVAILGTGSASCRYDGTAIVAQTPSLGYILGDEGSGAVLGRTLVHEIYKGSLSGKIRVAFEQETGLSVAEIIRRVYREPLPNRFLGSLSPFIHRHLGDVGVRTMVINCFDEFFWKNIDPYRRSDLPVNFVGSVAWHYQDELRVAATLRGHQVGSVSKGAIEGLVGYHDR